jgi:Kef-type K+ transport system membrane component KefB
VTVAETNVRMLLAVAVVIVGVRVVGWLVAKVGQPRVLGEIAAGIVLGPSLLGQLVPGAVEYLFAPPVVVGLRTLSQLGLVLFMFLIGIDVDAAKLHGAGRTVAAVSQASVAVPAVLAFGLAIAIEPAFGGGTGRLGFCLFFAAAMSVTAFPVLARILRESGLVGTRVGTISLLSAAVNDVAAWLLVAVVVAVVGSAGSGDVVVTALLAAGYAAAMVLVVRPLLARMDRPPIWVVLVVAVLSAWTCERIGIHAIFGAFVAGSVMPSDPRWRQAVRARLDPVVSNLLLPVFFVVVGMSTRADQLTGAGFALLGAVVAVAVIGKVGGAALGARAAGESWRDAFTLGVLMNARGVTEIVILTVGLDLGIISSTVFTVMVLMALVTTVVTAPLLRVTGAVRAFTAPGGAPR